MSEPLAQVATQFLDRPGLAPGTVRSYECTLLPLLKQYGRWSIELLDRQVLEDYLNSLTHLAFKTHHRHQATLQALFNFAVEQGHLRANPIAHLKRRKPDPKKAEHDSGIRQKWLAKSLKTAITTLNFPIFIVKQPGIFLRVHQHL